MKVQIGNNDHILAKRKTNYCNINKLRYKNISDIFYILDIDQNLLSVGQLIENEFKVIFKDQCRHDDVR
jgi:hypothetical protein